MRKTIALLVLFISVFAFSQTYEVHYRFTPILDAGDENSEELTKMLGKEQLAKMNEMLGKPKFFLLKFSENKSIFLKDTSVEEEKMEDMSFQDGNTKVVLMFNESESETYIYKDLDELTLTKQADILGKEFIIHDKLTEFDWKIEDSIKKIGDLECKKATLRIEKTPEQFASEQKHAKDKNNVKSYTDYTAYYAESIPINDGPDNYFGLPGLIVEFVSDEFRYEMTELKITKENSKFDKPKKGKTITQKEFDTIFKEKTQSEEVYF